MNLYNALKDDKIVEGSFGEQSYPLEPMYAEKVSFVFTPATDLRKGEYKIVMKAVKV
jgi:hypothetical protein